MPLLWLLVASCFFLWLLVAHLLLRCGYDFLCLCRAKRVSAQRGRLRAGRGRGEGGGGGSRWCACIYLLATHRQQTGH